MRWSIEVTAVEGDERLLRDVLTSLDLSLIEKEGVQYLTGVPFESCNSALEVNKKASEFRRGMAEASLYDVAMKLNLELGSRIVEHRPDGEGVDHVIVPLTGVVAVTLAGDICVATGTVGTLDEAEARRLAEEKAEREYRVRLANALTRVRSAHRSPDAVAVQRRLAGDLTPQAIYWIYEVLKHNTKGALESLGPSKNQWSRFRGSVNHPEVFGDETRHGKLPEDPPQNPMSKEEAQTFICAAALEWLRQVSI